MAVIADIGTVLRLTPQDDLQIASGDDAWDFCRDETPFDFRVQRSAHRYLRVQRLLRGAPLGGAGVRPGTAYWGKGLMHQAVAAVLQWAFQQDRVDRVHAYVRVDNTRSERLLARSGFVREGCLRSYRVCRGQPHDFYLYGLLRSDWAAVTLTHGGPGFLRQEEGA